MPLSIGNLLLASLLWTNAVAILNQERFLVYSNTALHTSLCI